MSLFDILCRSRSVPLHVALWVASICLVVLLWRTDFVSAPRGASANSNTAAVDAARKRQHSGVFLPTAAILADVAADEAAALASAAAAATCTLTAATDGLALSRCERPAAREAAAADASAAAACHYEVHLHLPATEVWDAVFAPERILAAASRRWEWVVAMTLSIFVVSLSVAYA